MARHAKTTFLILLIPFLCGISEAAFVGDKLSVAVTILPEAEFVERVGGEYTDVCVMVPKGVDPHTYEPTPAQLKKVGDADLYFKLGSGIEFELAWMDKIALLNKDLAVIDLSDGIGLLGKDPHTWLSPKNVIIMIGHIKDALIARDPAHKAEYQKNADKYTNDLSRLDSEIKSRLAGRKRVSFMTFHPSWGYFARDYGLEEISIEREGKEPTMASMKKVVDEARANGIKTVFVSPEFSRRSSEVVAGEIGGTVAAADPLRKDYIDNLRYVAGVLAKEVE